MTGPEHYREAERLLEEQGGCRAEEHPCPFCVHGTTKAQVHATLALAAATALGHLTESGPLSADRQAWIATASEHPAQQHRIREAEAEEAMA